MVKGEMGKQMVSGGPEFERVNGGQAQQTTGGRGWGNVHFFVSATSSPGGGRRFCRLVFLHFFKAGFNLPP
jgi:hypothetical protein